MEGSVKPLIQMEEVREFKWKENTASRVKLIDGDWDSAHGSACRVLICSSSSVIIQRNRIFLGIYKFYKFSVRFRLGRGAILLINAVVAARL